MSYTVTAALTQLKKTAHSLFPLFETASGIMRTIIAHVFLLLLLGAALGLAQALAAAPLRGKYMPPEGGLHPFVLAKPAEYRALLTKHTSITEKALARLQALVQHELRGSAELSQAYSGCELAIYLHKLTYEVGAAAKAADDLALYAYLSGLHLGYGQPALAAQAENLAKSILLNWARGGFRENGQIRTQVTQFCENGKVSLASEVDVGLQIGRGMPDWVAAEDLLTAINAFTPAERAALDGFLDQMDILLLNASNFFSDAVHTECVRYSNHKAVQILAMLAIERFRNNAASFVDTATLGHRLRTPWAAEVEGAIYGFGDTVRPCMHNTPQPSGHGGIFQTSQVAPGEIVDRFRAGRDQTFGYPIFTLTELMLSAEILQNAGFEPMKFVGSKGQSLPLALNYYAYYFTTFLSPQATVVRPRAGHPYPSEQQYTGHPVSGAQNATVDGEDRALMPFLIGYHLDPGNPGARSVVVKAMSYMPQVLPFFMVDPAAYNCLAALP